MMLFEDVPDIDPADIQHCSLCDNLFYAPGQEACSDCRRWMGQEEESLLAGQVDAAYERMMGG